MKRTKGVSQPTKKKRVRKPPEKLKTKRIRTKMPMKKKRMRTVFGPDLICSTAKNCWMGSKYGCPHRRPHQRIIGSCNTDNFCSLMKISNCTCIEAK